MNKGLLKMAAFGAVALAAAGCAKTGSSSPACPRKAECPGTGEVHAQRMRHGGHHGAQGMHGPAHGMRGGAHPMQGGPMDGPGAGGPAAGCQVGSGSLPDDARKAVESALADERRAETEYEQLAEQVRAMPLEHTTRAERRHALALERLLTAHGHPLPPQAQAAAKPSNATTLREACALGVTSERKNIALYDELLTRSLPPDVRCTFEHLRNASATRHLPAFERCASP